MKTPLVTEVDFGRGHIVLDGVPAVCQRRTTAPLFGPCLLWPPSPISATAELLYKWLPKKLVITDLRTSRFSATSHALFPFRTVNDKYCKQKFVAFIVKIVRFS